MGFAWRLPPGESMESFFHLYHKRKDLQSPKPMMSEIIYEENALLSSDSNNKLASASELTKMREIEKDFELDDLLLVTSSIFGNSKFVDNPSSSDILPDSMISLLKRFFAIREKLISNSED